MKDAEIRAELERIGGEEQTLLWYFDILIKTDPYELSATEKVSMNALRLLAEQHKALREIGKMPPKTVKIMLSQEVFKCVACSRCK